MSSFELREYQKECLQSIQDNYKQGINCQLVHMATGSGKTVVFASLIAQMNCRSLVLAHTCELLEQARDKIKMVCPCLDVGIVKGGLKQYDKQVIVASIQSARKPETLAELQKQGFKLCIYDETHRILWASSKNILSALGFLDSKDKLLCGFSATPFRADGKGLGEIFKKVVYHKSVKDLIDLGYLCKPHGIRIKSDLDLSSVTSADGDFVATSLAEVMNTPEMIDLVVSSYLERCIGRKAVCFGVTVDHSKKLAMEFKARGVSSECIHGETLEDERKSLLERFKTGSIDILTNCQILTEGWDCPEVDCVVLAKPTQSKGLYTQMAGRGLRTFPNKRDCLILDFGAKTHSLCSAAVLEGDSEETEKKNRSEESLPEFAKGLPANINQKLRSSLIEFDLLGDSFTWSKNGSEYALKSSQDKTLKIIPNPNGMFNVVFHNSGTFHTVAKGLSFEYAFGVAEGFAKENRSQFAISDLDAPWRKLKISDKQKDIFRSHGFKAGIDDLSRGQAAIIISSGVLNKKAISNKMA
jgi:ATP-dependent helicase IRC3